MCSSYTLGCRVAAVWAGVLLVAGFAPSATASIIYTETFTNTTTENQTLIAHVWGARVGSGCVDQSHVTQGTAVSYYIGAPGTQGVAFTTVASPDWRSLVATSTTIGFAAIDQSAYSSLTFSWEQWNGNLTQKSQLAVEIGGAWYVSQDTFSTASVYGTSGITLTNGEVKSLTLASASGWYALTVIPDMPNGLGVGSASSLPTTGSITGAGLYCTASSGSDALLLDDFQISGVAAVPEPGMLALLVGGLMVPLAARRRR